MSSTDSNLQNKYQKIDVISDSPEVLKKSIKLCFTDSDHKAKSFVRTDSSFVFYKTSGDYKLNNLGADGVYTVLINYLNVQAKLRNPKMDKKFDYTFTLSSGSDNGDEILSISFLF